MSLNKIRLWAYKNPDFAIIVLLGFLGIVTWIRIWYMRSQEIIEPATEEMTKNM